jgi:hypothetical protein
LSESLSDEAVVDLMRKEATEKMMVRVEENRLNQSRIAMDKRSRMLSGISDDDKEFLAEAKAILDNTPDDFVLRENYDLEDVLRYSRGDKSRIAKMVKDAEERGYKRGKEEPRILGEKNPSKVAGKTSSGDVKSTFSSKLSADQRQSALNKFDGQAMSDEDKFKSYYEIYCQKK